MERLVRLGIDVNVKNDVDMTALHYAAVGPSIADMFVARNVLGMSHDSLLSVFITSLRAAVIPWRCKA